MNCSINTPPPNPFPQIGRKTVSFIFNQSWKDEVFCFTLLKTKTYIHCIQLEFGSLIFVWKMDWYFNLCIFCKEGKLTNEYFIFFNTETNLNLLSNDLSISEEKKQSSCDMCLINSSSIIKDFVCWLENPMMNSHPFWIFANCLSVGFQPFRLFPAVE